MNEVVQIHYSPHFCLVKNLTIYRATTSGLLICTSWSPFTSMRWKFCLLVTSSRCFVIYLIYLATTAGTVVRSARVGHVTPFNTWKYQMTQLSVNNGEKKCILHCPMTCCTVLVSFSPVTTKWTRVELLVSHWVPPQVADRGTLARYGGYRGNKILGADQNQYCCLAADRGICKG